MFALGILAVTALSPPHTHWGYLWPTGIATGALLIAPRRTHGAVVAGIAGVGLASFVIGGYPLLRSVGYGLGIAGEAVITYLILVGDRARPHPFSGPDELPRLVGAPLSGAAFSGTVFALTAAATGAPDWWAVGVAAFLTHGASQAMMLNLFRPDVPAPASFRWPERATAWILTVAVTAVTFLAFGDASLSLLVVPLLGWMTFRASTREATVQLAFVAVTSALLTALGRGPFVESSSQAARISPQLSMLPYLVFVIACTMVTVPFSVAVARGREALRAVRQERARTELIMDSAVGIVLVVTDADGRISGFGPGAEAILGYSVEEVRGRSPAMFHTDAEIRRQARDLGVAPTFPSVVTACDALPPGTARDWEFLRKDGQVRTLSVILSPIRDDGALVGHVATGDDVTDRVVAQNALANALEVERRAVDQLRAVDLAKDDFISTVSHELRTPMTNIVGYLELLRDGTLGDPSPLQADAIGRIDGSALRLLNLVDDLLALSSTRAPEGPDLVVIDVRSVVHGAVGLARPEAARWSVDLVDELPPEPVEIRGEAGELERLVLNLVTNAVKFTHQVGGLVTVRLRPADGLLGPVLEVEDQGVGIGEPDQAKIFTRFYRSDHARRQAIPGTGLGLAIVKEIADRHDAHVTVDSRLGDGATFRVCFPVPDREPAEVTSLNR